MKEDPVLRIAAFALTRGATKCTGYTVQQFGMDVGCKLSNDERQFGHSAKVQKQVYSYRCHSLSFIPRRQL